MNTFKTAIAGLAGIALSAAPLAAQGEWSFSVRGGIATPVGGDVHRGPSFDGSVLLDMAPGSLPVDVDAKSFDDVYGDFNEFALEAAYRQNENLSYFFGLSKMMGNEETLRVGTVAGSLPLMGTFSDYEDIGLFGGVRYHFVNDTNWQPFVSAQVNVKDVEDINASFMVPDVTFVDPYQAALTNAAFYDGGTTFGAGIGLGVEYRASEMTSISLETGYYMQEALDDNDSVLNVLGLGALNDEGDLEYMPINLRVSFRY